MARRSVAQLRVPELEFVIAGQPVSAQSKRRDRLAEWIADIASTARRVWLPGRPPLSDEVELLISEFSEKPRIDRDNLAKPVQDALQAIAYVNDRQVKRLHVEWCDIDAPYLVRHMSPALALALSAGQDFLWVRVVRHQPRRDLLR